MAKRAVARKPARKRRRSPRDAPAKGFRFVDATGFPVLPSTNLKNEPYWYREDVRVRRYYATLHYHGDEYGEEQFYGSRSWMRVQRHFDQVAALEGVDGTYGDVRIRPPRGTDLDVELAYEVPLGTEVKA